MTKRAIASLLWFVAIWFGFEILWSVAEVPRLVGPVLAATVATLVAFDPTGHFLRSRSSRHETARQLPASGRSVI
jgi:hypothetical protein